MRTLKWPFGRKNKKRGFVAGATVGVQESVPNTEEPEKKHSPAFGYPAPSFMEFALNANQSSASVESPKSPTEFAASGGFNNLPRVDGSTWLRPYKPSGICPKKTILFMFGVGILAGAVIGAIGYYGGFVTSAIPPLLLIISRSIGIKGLKGIAFQILVWVFGLIFVFVIPLMYPILLGLSLGALIWLQAKKGKCRNSALAGGIAFVCGVVAYGIFAFMAIKLGGGLHETSYYTLLLPSLSSTSVWMYLLVAVDASLLVGSTIIIPMSHVSVTPFCEECNQWYPGPIKRIYPTDIANPLVLTLESGLLQYLENSLPPKRPENRSFPYDYKGSSLMFELQRCTCDQADFKLTANLQCQDVKVNNKGKKEIKNKNKTWFSTMVPASLGRQLETILFTPTDVTTLDPQQALADLNQALALAPEEEKVEILRSRDKLNQRLASEAEATRDQIASIESEDAFEGAGNLGWLFGADKDSLKKQLQSGERQLLLNSGKVKALGYCPKCKDVVLLDNKLHCQKHEHSRIPEVRLVIPEDIDQTRNALLASHNRNVHRVKARWVVLTVIMVCGVLILAQLPSRSKEPAFSGVAVLTTVTLAPKETSAPKIFDEKGFYFQYPGDWEIIKEGDVDTLLATSLKGIDMNQVEYIGGVYIQGLNNCSGCAQVIIVIIQVPEVNSTLSDELFEATKKSSQESMGDRLLSFDRTSIDSLPAMLSKHIGRTGETQLWDFIIIPNTPGLIYELSLSASRNDFAHYVSQFQAIVENIKIDHEAQLQKEQVATTATPPQVAGLAATVLYRSIYLRAGPSTGYEVVGGLVMGQEIRITGRNEAGDWLCMQTPEGKYMWLSAPLVTVNGAIQSLPVMQYEPE